MISDAVQDRLSHSAAFVDYRNAATRAKCNTQMDALCSSVEGGRSGYSIGTTKMVLLCFLIIFRDHSPAIAKAEAARIATLVGASMAS